MSVLKLSGYLFGYDFYKFHLWINTANYKMCYADAKRECLTGAIDMS